jgi:hypothetical protein
MLVGSCRNCANCLLQSHLAPGHGCAGVVLAAFVLQASSELRLGSFKVTAMVTTAATHHVLYLSHLLPTCCCSAQVSMVSPAAAGMTGPPGMMQQPAAAAGMTGGMMPGSAGGLPPAPQQFSQTGGARESSSSSGGMAPLPGAAPLRAESWTLENQFGHKGAVKAISDAYDQTLPRIPELPGKVGSSCCYCFYETEVLSGSAICGGDFMSCMTMQVCASCTWCIVCHFPWWRCELRHANSAAAAAAAVAAAA